MSEFDDHAREAIELGNPAEQIQQLLSMGQTRRARERAAAWVAQRPDDPQALLVLSVVLMASEESEAALDAARQALERAPESAEIWAQLGRALFVLGRFAEAEGAIRAAQAADPSDARFFLLSARLLAACERNEEALADVQHALALDPDDVETHQLLSGLLLTTKMSRWKLSRQAAERAVRLDPEDPDSHAALGAVHLSAREIPEAEARFLEALRLNPADALARRGLAEALMARKPWYRPLLAFGTFLQTQPPAMRWLVILAPWVLVSSLSMALADRADAEGLRNGIVWTYYAFCAYTWFAEPIARRILARHYPWMSER
jgi:tetratricopeptide (TPR) repeat protein